VRITIYKAHKMPQPSILWPLSLKSLRHVTTTWGRMASPLIPRGDTRTVITLTMCQKSS
jgi:hypothetical protein